MNITQIAIGRFHHFHLARQLERRNLLHSLYTGYPRFKLKDEQGIPQEKIKVYPWVHAPYMARLRFGLGNWKWLGREMGWLACETLDNHVAKNIKETTTVVALSSSGLRAGQAAQRLGGKYICDRGSSHIGYQDELLREEYQRWGLTFYGVDQRVIAKELKEYEFADKITVPSEFARRSFIEKGIPAEKIEKIPYGARLDRFHKTGDPDANTFRVLWVGAISVQKGFLYTLQAFQKLKHPKKELVVIGAVHSEVKNLLSGYDLSNVSFKGLINNAELPDYYSSAHVFVLSSIQEGLAMVQGEALACGCPVIASNHTGSEDLFTDGKEGFIVPIRSVEALTDRLQQLADDRILRERMSAAALKRVQHLGGWDTYGNTFTEFLYSIQ